MQCPSGLTQIDYAVGWSSFRQSPDYFNSCAPPGSAFSVSVPSNAWGYQYALTGNAYAGLTTFSLFNNFREFMGIQLNQPLDSGIKYFVSFYVSRSVNNLTAMNLASNKIGILMSTIPFSSSGPAPINNFAHVYSDSIIADTLNWIKISGSFIADSSYHYIILGNFFNDSATSFVSFDTSAAYAYYYFDDIKISSDSNFVNSSSEFNFINHISIFPNPAKDWIEIQGDELYSIAIYDILGKIIYFNPEFISSQSINTASYSKGIYFLKAKTKNNTINKKIIIQ